MSAERFSLADRLALRPKEAALALGVSERTLRDWMRNEGLPYARVGNAVVIPRAALCVWLGDRVRSEQRSNEAAAAMLAGFS